MPYRANAARRHHIARPKRRVLNWAECDAALRQRGSLTVWAIDNVAFNRMLALGRMTSVRMPDRGWAGMNADRRHLHATL